MNEVDLSPSEVRCVNFDEAPIAVAEVEGIDYRVDVGHGSLVAISQRPAGTWDWLPVAEGRWDGSRLKAKSLSHDVNAALTSALVVATDAWADALREGSEP